MSLEIIYALVQSDDAVTSIEYALIAALIAVVILTAVTLAGTRTLDLMQLIAGSVAAAAAGNACS